MKKIVCLLLCCVLLVNAQSQPLNIKDSSFSQVFLFLYNSAGNYFKEVKGRPIMGAFNPNDTIGYRLRLLPAGVTDWKNIGIDMNNNLDISFKLGEYMKDSAEMAKRFYDLIDVIKAADPSAVVQEDNSYSDTKIKEVYICSGGSYCGENGKWRVNLYFHRFSGGEYNVTVNMQAYP